MRVWQLLIAMLPALFMDTVGLEQVAERLSRLRSTQEIITSSESLAERQSAWLDFLQYHGTIYSKIEQAAKAPHSSRLWFEKKRAERKSDELLVYLLHARNVGEHTILKTASNARFAVSGPSKFNGAPIGLSFDRNCRPVAIGYTSGDEKVYENEIFLHPVKDRGVTYKTPKTHLGKIVDGKTAKELATLALTHIELMMSEAWNFVETH